MAPAPDATVLAPDVEVVGDTHLARLASTDAATVTFNGSVPFAVGNVLLARPTPAAPTGLMRRVVALRTVGGTSKTP